MTPLTSPKIRWGILSTGKIAQSFVQGLRHLPDAEVAAVGSRTEEAAARFGDRFGIPHRHGSYAALAADPDVDAIYIATPHNLHAENTILCLEAGKAVLCEKPFAINAAQAERMIAAARAEKHFFNGSDVDAVSARGDRAQTPALRRGHRRAADDGGELRLPRATSIRPAACSIPSWAAAPFSTWASILSRSPIILFGKPCRMARWPSSGKPGVDERAGVVLGFPRGQIAVLHFSLVADLPTDLTVMGSEGRIRAHAPIFRPDKTDDHQARSPPRPDRRPGRITGPADREPSPGERG